ncbi:sulfite exporter TauE/SafE family protein [Roseicyclus sp. F158]|uniref:Probable membrane transporter protein n=1 Tax=Tropicimonas omnivorans TaxID=3075590 RepID=A0ABU3DGE0_9RHOB|nr:sulfite exporter TauE/SafE family protein [Roseicyclus sp. F158]MDT0682759.1 sulfite exporter TauE/SafE family protein [Roseicyclus sp. F158]
MPDAILAALALPGAGVVAGAALVAGFVYGFAGFGASLVYMPVAGLVLGPEAAVVTFVLSGLGALVSVLPGALRIADGRGLATTLAGAIALLPVGLVILTTVDPVPLRWAVCTIIAATLVALAFGWRYQTRPHWTARLGVGVTTGVLGGATGLMSPILILFHLSGDRPPREIRAETGAFLAILNAALLPGLWWRGVVSAELLWLGLLLLPLYTLGSWAGTAAFTPASGPRYRPFAYAVVAGSVLIGLPIFD